MKLRTYLLAGLAIVATSVLAVQAQVPGVNSTLNAVFNLVYDNSTMKPTYSSTAIVVPASSATDVCTLKGSATKNVRVRRVIISGIAQASVSEPVGILKRSTTNTGAGAQPPMVPYDTTNSLTPTVTNAATASVETFTSNPTVGTLVGALADIFVGFGPASASPQNYAFEFGQRGSPVVLRGILQQLAINLNGVTITSGQLTCTFEWTEE